MYYCYSVELVLQFDNAYSEFYNDCVNWYSVVLFISYRQYLITVTYMN